eukprot:c30560_g1_i1 orf=761-1018(-)
MPPITPMAMLWHVILVERIDVALLYSLRKWACAIECFEILNGSETPLLISSETKQLQVWNIILVGIEKQVYDCQKCQRQHSILLT